MNWIDWMWLSLTFVCIILELLTSGIFFILFAIGTIAAFIFALFSNNITGQVITFAVITLISLLFLRPVIRRWLHLGKYGAHRVVPNYIEQNIGKVALVIQEIPANEKGQVRIGTEVWTARSSDGAAIANTQSVRVVRIEGVTAVVEPTEDLTGEEMH